MYVCDSFDVLSFSSVVLHLHRSVKTRLRGSPSHPIIPATGSQVGWFKDAEDSDHLKVCVSEYKTNAFFFFFFSSADERISVIGNKISVNKTKLQPNLKELSSFFFKLRICVKQIQAQASSFYGPSTSSTHESIISRTKTVILDLEGQPWRHGVLKAFGQKPKHWTDGNFDLVKALNETPQDQLLS